MQQPLKKTAESEADLLGDLTPLLDQIGSPAGMAALAAAWSPPDAAAIVSPAALRSFLTEYHNQVLVPVELPAIQRAFIHAGKNELRELVAFDRSLADSGALKGFAAASQAIGLSQLRRLRPLRDQRFSKRYLAAVEEGTANGWHTVVFGVTLAIYSLPLRPGLIGYARRTTRGFIQSSARALNLSPTDVESLAEELSAAIPATVQSLLAPGSLGA